MQGRRIAVTGTVQGVFFRQSTSQQAELLGLAGWVRNLADGSVEIAAFGDQTAIAQLVEWCQAGGPSQASVDEVTSEPLAYEEHDEFRVVD